MFFLVVNFHNFASIKRDHQHQQMIFNFRNQKITNFFFNVIILEWVLKLVAKI
jgi:hypothetical protein